MTSIQDFTDSEPSPVGTQSEQHPESSSAVPNFSNLNEDVAAASDSNRTCPICLDGEKEEDEFRSTVCNHYFHAQCLEEWLNRLNATCPLCRTLLRITSFNTAADAARHLDVAPRNRSRRGG